MMKLVPLKSYKERKREELIDTVVCLILITFFVAVFMAPLILQEPRTEAVKRKVKECVIATSYTEEHCKWLIKNGE